MFKLIHLPTLIIFLALGLFVNYVVAPPLDIIYVYPTPENVDILQYKDTADNCFSIEQKEVSCPIDKGEISEIKPQV